MLMRILPLLLVFANLLLAQNECGFEISNEEYNLMRTRLSEGYYDHEGERDLPDSINVAVHIVLDENGESAFDQGGYSSAQILEKLNGDFAQANIRFKLSYEHRVLGLDSLYDYGDSLRVDTSYIPGVRNALDIVIVRDVGWPFAFALSGNRVVVPHTGSVVGTVSHEVGHYFYLVHTFEGRDSLYAREFVDRLLPGDSLEYSCEERGDLLCDTPADVFGGSLGIGGSLDHCVDDMSCTLVPDCLQPLVDTYDSVYVPSVTNFMSYTSACCMSEFSPSQIQIMTTTIENQMPELFAPDAFVDFVGMSALSGNGDSLLDRGEEFEITMQIGNESDEALALSSFCPIDNVHFRVNFESEDLMVQPGQSYQFTVNAWRKPTSYDYVFLSFQFEYDFDASVQGESFCVIPFAQCGAETLPRDYRVVPSAEYPTIQSAVSYNVEVELTDPSYIIESPIYISEHFDVIIHGVPEQGVDDRTLISAIGQLGDVDALFFLSSEARLVMQSLNLSNSIGSGIETLLLDKRVYLTLEQVALIDCLDSAINLNSRRATGAHSNLRMADVMIRDCGINGSAPSLLVCSPEFDDDSTQCATWHVDLHELNISQNTLNEAYDTENRPALIGLDHVVNVFVSDVHLQNSHPCQLQLSIDAFAILRFSNVVTRFVEDSEENRLIVSSSSYPITLRNVLSENSTLVFYCSTADFLPSPAIDNLTMTQGSQLLVGNTAEYPLSLFISNSILSSNPIVNDETFVIVDESCWIAEDDGDPMLAASGEPRWNSPCLDFLDEEELEFDQTYKDIGWKPELQRIVVDGSAVVEILEVAEYEVVASAEIIADVIPAGTKIRVNPGASLSIISDRSLQIGDRNGPRTSIAGAVKNNEGVWERSSGLAFKSGHTHESDISFGGVLFNQPALNSESGKPWLSFDKINLDLDFAQGADHAGNSFMGYDAAEVILHSCEGHLQGIPFGETHQPTDLALSNSSTRISDCVFNTHSASDSCSRAVVVGVAKNGLNAVFAKCDFESSDDEDEDENVDARLSLRNASVSMQKVHFNNFSNLAIQQAHSSLYMRHNSACRFEANSEATAPLIEMQGGLLDIFCGYNLFLHGGLEQAKFITYDGDEDPDPVVYDWRRNLWSEVCPGDPITDEELIQSYIDVPWAQIVEPLSSCEASVRSCTDWMSDPRNLLTAGKNAESGGYSSIARAYFRDVCILFPKSPEVSEAGNRLKSVGQRDSYGEDNFESVSQDLFAASQIAEDQLFHKQAVHHECNAWLVKGYHGDRSLVRSGLVEMKKDESDRVCIKTIDSALAELVTYPPLSAMSASHPSARFERQIVQKQALRDFLFDSGNSVIAPLEELNDPPSEFEISKTFPNPFNPILTIILGVPVEDHVRVRVCNLLGQQVAVLHDSELLAGTHKVQFDGSKFGSGLYIIQAESSLGAHSTQKVMLLK
jgi:hypothetical protein